jgi:hypothetical protein
MSGQLSQVAAAVQKEKEINRSFFINQKNRRNA